MKAENIKRANVIIDRLGTLKDQFDNWSNSFSFNKDSTVYVTLNNNGRAFVRWEFLNIDICRPLACAAISKEIKELEAELETL